MTSWSAKEIVENVLNRAVYSIKLIRVYESACNELLN